MLSDVDLMLPLLLEEKQLTDAGKKKLDKLARQLLKKKPETRTADENFVLGYAADQVYDLDAAVTYFTDAIKGSPDFEAAYRFRASTLLRQEKYADAEADINKALELDPEYRDAKIDRARLLHETGKPEEALEIISALEAEHSGISDNDSDDDDDIDMDVDVDDDDDKDDEEGPDLELTLLKGKIYDRMNRYEEAISCYDEVAKAVPDNSDVYSQRSLTRFFSGDYEGALKDMKEAQKNGPQGHIGHFNMGLILLAFPGQTKDAFRYFERAFKKEPDMLKNYLTTANELESERLYDAMKDHLARIKKEDDDQGRFYRENLIDLLERKLP